MYADDLQEGIDAIHRNDFETAYKLLMPLAEQGDAKAQHNLGIVYFNNGNDFKEAVKWWKLSADQDNADSQYTLGRMHLMGFGVIQDYVQAHKWFNVSGANGDEDGRKSREIVEKKMTPPQIAEAQKLAREWMENK